MIKKLTILLVVLFSTSVFAMKHGSVIGNDLLFGNSSSDFLITGSSDILLAQ